MISELSEKELILLCRGALGLCQGRLKYILENADPSDGPLCALLEGIVAEEAETVGDFRELDWRMPFIPDQTFDFAKGDSVLKKHFASALSMFGEGALNRDQALYFVEILEKERSEFFRVIADANAADGSARVFSREHERGLRRIEALRTIVLSHPASAFRKVKKLERPPGGDRD